MSGDRKAERHYDTMTAAELQQLPVADLAAEDCVLFLWVTWPLLQQGLALIEHWGFRYKTCAFSWLKAETPGLDILRNGDVQVGLGYWTRANTEACLLATRGSPSRLNADVRQGIVSPRRQHSRKPDCVHERIERLVEGPYAELFARAPRDGWDSWGKELHKFTAQQQPPQRRSILIPRAFTPAANWRR